MIGWLPARERWRWLLLVPIAGLAALIEAAGALAVFGLLRLVVDPEQVRTAPVVSQLWRAVAVDDPRAVVALLALGVGVFYVLRAAFLSWAEWLRQGMVYGSSAIAAERLLARYLGADYLFHVERRSASLIEPMTRATDIAYELVRRIGGQHSRGGGDHRGAGGGADRLGAADHARDRRRSSSASCWCRS